MRGWPQLPRMNPCVPCMIAVNPEARDECSVRGCHEPVSETGNGRCARHEIEHDAKRRRALDRGGEGRRRLNPCGPSVHIDMPGAHAAKGRGRTVEVNENPIGAGDLVKLTSQYIARYGGDKRKVYEVVKETAGGDYDIRPVGSRGEGTIVRRGNIEFHARGNPRLMVLNPHSAESLIAQAEKSLRRRLTAKELANAHAAIKEFKTFHGRLPESLTPVDAPPNTPLFLNYVGHELRRDYEVRINSERKGRWTHKAGDHGGKRHTPQAIIASVPGRKKHNTVTVEPRGAKTFFKPTHGLMG